MCDDDNFLIRDKSNNIYIEWSQGKMLGILDLATCGYLYYRTFTDILAALGQIDIYV